MNNKTVIEIGEDEIIACAPNRDIESAILILGTNKFRRLPITKLGKINGILTITDILKIITKVGIQQAFHERVSDWMTTTPVTIHYKSSVLQSVKVMAEKGIGSLLLVDDNGEICRGIVTERDILNYFKSDKWSDVKLSELGKYLQIGFIQIPYDTSLEKAINIMSDEHTHRVIVQSKEGKGLYGMLTANDITKLISQEREEISSNPNFLTSCNAGFVSSGRINSINEDASLQEAIDIMRKEKFGALPVMGQDGRLIGIISERSLLQYIADTEE